MDSIKGSTLERLPVELDEWPQTEGQHGSCYFIASSKYYGPYHPDIVVTTEGFTSRNWRDAKALLDAKPEAPEWDGEGLPPVGVECEVLDPVNAEHDEQWLPCRIVAHDSEFAIYHLRSDVYRGAAACRLRPIRSEEDKAVEEMEKIYRAVGGPSIAEGMRAVYRAGFKRQ